MNAMAIIMHELISFFMFTRITATSGQFFGNTSSNSSAFIKKGKNGQRPAVILKPSS